MDVFKLPDVGEGLTEADIVEWRVSEGDTVTVNQVIVEIETAKSLVELPSPYAGTVAKLFAQVGDTLMVGEPLIGVEPAGGSATPDEGKDSSTADAQPGPLVGSGPKAESTARRRRRTTQQAAAPEPVPTAQAAQPAPQQVAEPAQPAKPAQPVQPGQAVLATPPVRLLAKNLGLDLASITPTGDRGQITRADVEQAGSAVQPADASVPQNALGTSNASGASDTAVNSITERVPVKGVRKATATATTQSYQQVPHVWVSQDVDVTRTFDFVGRLKKDSRWEGVKVSPLLIAARAVVRAMQLHPEFNATWVESSAESGAPEIHRFRHVNLSLAAATPRGLLVPVIHRAEQLNLRETAVAINELAERARAGKTQPAEMAHGTVAITNIGALGLKNGSPILPTGHTAILALGSAAPTPWVVDGSVVPRKVMSVGGSFDHRVVDGADIAEFMASIVEVLNEPALLVE